MPGWRSAPATGRRQWTRGAPWWRTRRRRRSGSRPATPRSWSRDRPQRPDRFRPSAARSCGLVLPPSRWRSPAAAPMSPRSGLQVPIPRRWQQPRHRRRATPQPPAKTPAARPKKTWQSCGPTKRRVPGKSPTPSSAARSRRKSARSSPPNRPRPSRRRQRKRPRSRRPPRPTRQQSGRPRRPTRRLPKRPKRRCAFRPWTASTCRSR